MCKTCDEQESENLLELFGKGESSMSRTPRVRSDVASFDDLTEKLTASVKRSMGIKESSEQEAIREKILANLAELGKLTTGEDDLVFEGTKFVLPENLRGNIGGAIQFLEDWDESQKERFSFQKVFDYRPWDGANAFQNAMLKMWGTTGVGKAVRSMFGTQLPTYRTISVGPNKTIQVPWGMVSFSPLEAEFNLIGTMNQYGEVFAIAVTAPRRYRAHIEAFFALVEVELRTGSIYRGKAITGDADPRFIDLSDTDRKSVIYTDDVKVQLETNMWSVLRYSQAMRDARMPLKRAVLVEGPYGTGKTLAGMLTAQEAVANGWTFILARTGEDDLGYVLKTAQLYAPAVVWYEDIDNVASGMQTDTTVISRILDNLDGITAKGKEILTGFTTNFVEKIHKGVLRPGRLDAVIHIGGLDRDGFERLIKVTVPAGNLDPNVDYDAVAEAFNGYVPAFAKEAIDRSLRYSMTRNGGTPGTITTADLVNAAKGLRPQWDLMAGAKEGSTVPTFDAAMAGMLSRTVVKAEDSYIEADLPLMVLPSVNGNGRG